MGIRGRGVIKRECQVGGTEVDPRWGSWASFFVSRPSLVPSHPDAEAQAQTPRPSTRQPW